VLQENREENIAIMNAPSNSTSSHPRRRWRYSLLAAVLVVVCLYVLRGPLLRSVAGYLVLEEPLPGAVDYVLVQPYGDGRYERAAQLYHAGLARSILLVERRPSRLERMGLLTPFETLTQQALAARGVPASAITMIPGRVRTDWQRARCLRGWFEQQPPVRIVVLCDRFGGRKLRYVFDQVLGNAYADRVRVLCLPDRRHDESNWWRQRTAVVDIFDTYVRLAFTRLVGESNEEWREWDPKEYEQTLR
jgi:hypothetical protein